MQKQCGSGSGAEVVRKWCGSGAEAVRSGAEAVWKRRGSGAEAVRKRCGSGAEAVRNGAEAVPLVKSRAGISSIFHTNDEVTYTVPALLDKKVPPSMLQVPPLKT